MVGKPLALVGVALVVAGIALTVMISVLQEWAIATIQVDEDNIVCTKEDNPLGTLGLYLSSYTPSCTDNSVFAASYGMFEDEKNVPTTEFWPLFPAQNNFGGYLGESFKFESCEKTYGTNETGNAIQGGSIQPFLNAAAGSFVAALKFGEADAGLAAANAEIISLLDVIFGVIDAAIASQWATAGAASFPTVHRFIYLSTFIGVSTLQNLADTINSTSSACALTVYTLLESTSFTLNTTLDPCVATFSEGGGLTDGYTAGGSFAEFAAKIDGSAVAAGAGLTDPEDIAGVQAMIALYSLLTDSQCNEGDNVLGCSMSIAEVEPSQTQAYFGFGESPEVASVAFEEEDFSPLVVKINATAAASLNPLVQTVWGKVFPLFGLCLQGGFTDRKSCLSGLFTNVNEDMNAEWGFCQLAVQGGVLDTTGIPACSSACSSLCVLQSLAATPELLPPQAAAYGALVGKLVGALNTCAANLVGYNGCKAFIAHPNLNAVYAANAGEPTPEQIAAGKAQQRVIPDDFDTAYGLCLAAGSDASALSGAFTPANAVVLGGIALAVTGDATFSPFNVANCASFKDAIRYMAVNYVVAKQFNGLGNLTDEEASESLTTLHGVFLKPCFLNETAGRAECLQYLAAESAAQTLQFDSLVLEATLENFVTPKAVESGSGFVAACEDDAKDIAAIELAQVLVPVAMGAEFVGLLLAILGVAKGNGKLLIAGAVLCVLGVASAAAGLINVQGAPMFELITDSCPDGKACYLGGIAKPLAYGALALPVVAAIVLSIASCMNKGSGETAVSGKVDSY